MRSLILVLTATLAAPLGCVSDSAVDVPSPDGGGAARARARETDAERATSATNEVGSIVQLPAVGIDVATNVSNADEKPPTTAPSTASALGPNEFKVEPRTINWQELDETTFAPTWLLPDGRVDGGVDLIADMRALLALAIEEKDTGRTLNFADLVAEARPLAGPERRAWFADLANRTPDFYAEWSPRVAELLLDDVLYSPSWKPSRDDARDGFLFAPSWSLAEDARLTWTPRDVTPLMEQAATLFFADAAAIKAAENDYRLYPKNVAADYDFIRPVTGSYVRGSDPAGRTFTSHQLTFRCDLPFPFSNYDCNLHVLTRVGPASELLTDIYSASNDFHYMAGRDVFLPVTTTDGIEIALLAVRLFGFDLDGVPDDAGNRREAMRGALGNLRRNAERLFDESGGVFRACEGGVPEYEMVGVRG